MTDKDAGEAARRIVERLRSRRDLIAKHGHSMTEAAVPELLDEAAKRIEELEKALVGLERAYIDALNKGYHRIKDLGGDCDTLDVMMAADPALTAARAALKGE